MTHISLGQSATRVLFLAVQRLPGEHHVTASCFPERKNEKAKICFDLPSVKVGEPSDRRAILRWSTVGQIIATASQARPLRVACRVNTRGTNEKGQQGALMASVVPETGSKMRSSLPCCRQPRPVRRQIFGTEGDLAATKSNARGPVLRQPRNRWNQVQTLWG